MDPLDQLAGEAAGIDQDAREASAGASAGASPGQGGGEDATGAPGAQSAPEGEHLPNPKPRILAALRVARAHPVTLRLVPAKALAVFTDPVLDELADVLAGLSLKYAPVLAPQLDSLAQRWGLELRAAVLIGTLAYSIFEATQAVDDSPAAAPGEAPPAGPGDPPVHVDGVVEPGARPV